MTRNPNKPRELRNIVQMDSPTFKGKTHRAWWVRFSKNGHKASRCFAYNKFGGKDKALYEAKRYRDEKEQEFAAIPKMNRRNKSGIVGILKADKTRVKKSGKSYTYTHWIANWVEPSGKRGSKTFAISQYGEAEALRLALKARDEAIARITGKTQPVSNWGKHTLIALIDLVESAKTSNEKGRNLEELIYRLFDNHPGFSITDSRVQTETEEIDLIVLNNSADPRFSRESAILLIECKNWSGKCGKNEFVIFKEKIENRSSRCSLGFLISWNGFAETVTKEMLRGSREQTLVIPVEGRDIKRAISEDKFEEVLVEAWHNAVIV